MTFELLSSIELTASAAIVVALLASGLAATPHGRAATAAGFAMWFLGVTAAAATGLLHRADVLGLAGVGTAVLAPIVIAVWAFSVSERVRTAVLRIPLTTLVAVHTVRVLGISFVLLYAAGRLPAPFAPVAGWGDIGVGLAAPLVAWLVAQRHARGRSVLIAWNTVGLADLVAAVGLGVASSPGILNLFGASVDAGLMTTLPWLLIPGFLVPTLAASHVAIFFRLRAGLDTPPARASAALPHRVVAGL
ncbi:MAG TPA: hypothetical protein VD833_13045 [Vicinamibacterales bacterium]|nr:hypothetical protein [Vicinamibacterales bacterium]